MNERPLILVTNDDGITAPGIRMLIEIMNKIGDVVVVAPDSPQSGMGHAITIGKPLRLKRSTIFKDIEAYECSGTPVDCVKLAVDKVIGRKPDICLSGVNHGSNSSINIIYSGTMSAAMEAAIEGIPAVGFSYLDYSAEADFLTGQTKVGGAKLDFFKDNFPCCFNLLTLASTSMFIFAFVSSVIHGILSGLKIYSPPFASPII